MLADAPHIPDRAPMACLIPPWSRDLPTAVETGAARVRRLIERMFDTDLTHRPRSNVRTGDTTGHHTEGYAYRESGHKMITVLLGH